MSRKVEDYTGRITPWQSNNPKFVETVADTITPIADAGAVSASLPAAFDFDTATGAQLDVVGQWVGRDRSVKLPIPNSYFSFDDANRGLDRGVWQGPYDTEVGITSLDDETYRRLLRALVLANHWDGTLPGAQAIFDAFFIDPATRVFLQDNAQVPQPQIFFALDVVGQGFDQGVWTGADGILSPAGVVDMSLTICVAGQIPPPVLLGLLGQFAIPIKPMGVTTEVSVTSVNNDALFGFDMANDYVAGFDAGAFGVSPDYLLAHA